MAVQVVYFAKELSSRDAPDAIFIAEINDDPFDTVTVTFHGVMLCEYALSLAMIPSSLRETTVSAAIVMQYGVNM